VAVSQGLVVSNTTPLINLVGVGPLDLLPGLYGAVCIPDAVRGEFTAGKSAADPDLTLLPWLNMVAAVPLDPALLPQLGAGEAAALSLALAQNARVLLLDEAYGRRVARQRGLPVAGTLSVLLAAKQAGLLPALGPVVDEMIRQGRRISARLRAADLLEPEELAADAIAELEGAVDELNAVVALLENGNKG
jgi:predicted nucleic acid-binding protein